MVGEGWRYGGKGMRSGGGSILRACLTAMESATAVAEGLGVCVAQ